MQNQCITDFSELPKIIAIDFDGTLCEDKFPDIGDPIEWSIELVRELKSRGWRTILWTCRNGHNLDEAVEWCKQQNVPIDYVNTNIDEAKQLTGNDTRKVFADVYFDEKNIGLNPYTVWGLISEVEAKKNA